jgi:hypothetical protein
MKGVLKAGLLALGLAVVAASTVVPAGAASTEAEVSVGSPDGPFSRNKQNEPAVAVDPSHPWLVAAGANDNIDMEACNAGDDTTCPFTTDVGGSGIYFSFDSGHTWMQPTYTGLTARSGACDGVVGPDAGCTAFVGPIGTLPWYDENGIVSDGDPALAFGPAPDSDGSFSWENGSRLYYANLVSNETVPGPLSFKGAEAIAVSRLDFPDEALDRTGAEAIVANQANWFDPVIVTKQSATTFSDKEQIWVDNASSSPFFGNAYVCLASFRSLSQGNALPTPLIVATSTDGGETWTNKQITDATNNPFNQKKGFGRSGCTIRTDSEGTVYVFANQFAVGLPGSGAHIMIRSFNGGHTWDKPVNIGTAVDTCFAVMFDGAGFRCVMDGLAGARDDLSSSPSVDIANGAPTGAGAKDLIYRTWVDGGAATGPGFSPVNVMFSFSTDGGNTWSTPTSVEASGDRGYYSAVAITPDGSEAWLVYNAFTTPYVNDTTSARNLVGVVLHTNVSPDGSPAAPGWAQVHRGANGDPRASAQNNLVIEFLGDYVYASALGGYGMAVWNDVRNGAPCADVDTWRTAMQAAPSTFPTGRPAVQQVCAITFGNTDIFGYTSAGP